MTNFAVGRQTLTQPQIDVVLEQHALQSAACLPTLVSEKSGAGASSGARHCLKHDVMASSQEVAILIEEVLNCGYGDVYIS